MNIGGKIKLFYYILFYSILFYYILFYSILFYSILHLFYSTSILFYSILLTITLKYAKCRARESIRGMVAGSSPARTAWSFSPSGPRMRVRIQPLVPLSAAPCIPYGAPSGPRMRVRILPSSFFCRSVLMALHPSHAWGWEYSLVPFSAAPC